ncbi:MAG: hypothetical protein U1D55_19080 [Phycisphaerae bacterium]
MTSPLRWGAFVAVALAAGWFGARLGQISEPKAFAQTPPLAGARGVYAFTGQLDANRHGLFMLDVDQGTIWCYEIESVGGARKLRLMSARSWIYDRYLQDFNCAAPDFRTVQELVAQQRGQTASADEERKTQHKPSTSLPE